MGLHTQQFDSYKVHYFTGRPETDEHTEIPPSYIVSCYAEGDLVGFMRFGGLGPPMGAQLDASDRIWLHCEKREFEAVHRILLNEGPLWLRYYTDSEMGFLATTSLEPVGEQEP